MTPSTVFQAIGAAVCVATLALFAFGSCALVFDKARERKRRRGLEQAERVLRDAYERQYAIAYRTAQCRARERSVKISPATLDELLSLIGSRVVEAES